MPLKLYVTIIQMKVVVKVKNIGEKSNRIKESYIKLKTIKGYCTLEDLIVEIVKYEVGRFRLKQNDNDLIQQITDGKVAFNTIFNKNKVDRDEAVLTALTAFKDGLFSVFLNNEEVTSLDSRIFLEPKSVLTFIKLTFLTGTYW